MVPLTITPTGGTAVLTAPSTGGSTAGSLPITTWSGAIGNGSASAVQQPPHARTAVGAFALSITAITHLVGSLQEGCRGSQHPTASFTATPESGPAPLTVSFVDTSTAGSSPITVWAWTFGDGGTSAAQHASHTYAAEGTYTVSLTVTTQDGSDTGSRSDLISVTGGVEGEVEGEGEGETSGSLNVTILPPDAVADGAIWTLDHGFNHESGQTVNNVAAGPHVISFKDLGSSWTTPAEQTVEVVASQTTSATGQYVVVRAIGDERTFAGIVFKWIPAGSFDMGTLKTSAELTAIYGDSGNFFDPEHPQHHVTISRGFWLGKFEVTQEQWSSRMPSNPSGDSGPTLPVEKVSWDDCQAFLAQLNQSGQGVFRLPTEAEWEYACRAGTETEFYWGDDVGVANDYAWHCLDWGHCSTQPVGGLLPNAWGLYDMSGNVMEWVNDCYDPAYYTADAVTDPQGPTPPTTGYVQRVRRGGGTADIHDIAFCRSAMRYNNIQGFAQPDTGFRILRESAD
jgi:formylglycine-generating enzyme required for sulfatase activity